MAREVKFHGVSTDGTCLCVRMSRGKPQVVSVISRVLYIFVIGRGRRKCVCV